MFHRLCLLVILLLGTSWQGEAMLRSSQSISQEKAASLGVRTLHYDDVERKRPVVVELWYPIDHPAVSDETPEDIWIHPKESRNTQLSLFPKKYPLILMSHGHGGDRRDRSWLAECLVRANFIVASVDHHGNTRGTLNPVLTLQFWDRAKDVSFALDQLLKESFLKGRINEKRIGFAGYSLGGMTGLALAGGIVDGLQESILKHRQRLPEIPNETLAQVDFSKATHNFRDPRIGAVLLLAPANFVYRPDALKQIKVPVGLISAINDEVLPHQDHSYPIIQHIVPVKLKVLRKEISHFAFLNPVSELGKKLLPAKLRAEPSCCTRAAIHREIGDFAIEFFNETLH